MGAREEGKVGGNRTIVITMATSSNNSNNTTPDEIYMKTFRSLTQNVQMLPIIIITKNIKIMS